jgi:hypothetical protein
MNRGDTRGDVAAGEKERHAVDRVDGLHPARELLAELEQVCRDGGFQLVERRNVLPGENLRVSRSDRKEPSPELREPSPMVLS